jgi:transposase
MNHKQRPFKPDKTGDGILLPPYLGEWISADHPVRLINAMVDKLDITDILATYKGGGASSYHPRILIKLLVYGYFDGVTSSRKLEQSARENICYMWLCGMNKPTYATISTFRSGRLQGKVKDLFASILKEIYKQNKLQLGTQFIDGTIFESAANKHTYVWRKNTERYKLSTEQKIRAVLSDVEKYLNADKSEDSEIEDKKERSAPKEQQPDKKAGNKKEKSAKADKSKVKTSFKTKTKEEPLTSEYVKKKIENYKKQKDQEVDKKIKKVEKELLLKLVKYEEQERILNGRNSYSKTDPDASFMRLKEDRRGKAIPKPAYNGQLSTHNQFILNYSLHQNSNDATCYIDHMVDTLQLFDKHGLPGIEESIGDAIYGTQQNYEFLEQQDIDSYLKYPFFDKELKSKENKKKPFGVRELFYNEEADFFVCPMGQRMHKARQRTETRKNGYEVTLDEYQNARCETCPLRGVCHKGTGVRRIQVNPRLESYRKEAFKNLTSEKGELLRRQRSVDVEPVFGHFKFNQQWDRFTLTSLKKTNIEFGLHCIGHNLRKWVKTQLKKAVFAYLKPVKIYEHSHLLTERKLTYQITRLTQTPTSLAA